ncbi:MAG: isopenicillin N synthase family oxygenase [Alphaproteobacteria bacterium]|nr:MAG: isopenicillin N synthase family oxygenase [Alphaproteobacteria bacterium]
MSSDAFIPNRERAAAANADIPVIDISPFFAGGKRTIVDEIARACEEVGFFGIVGHGVHEDTIAAIYREGRAFFDLPRDEKMEIARPAPAVSRGYNSLADQSLGNTLASGVPPDLQESFAIGPLSAGTGPYWTDAHGPIHFHPNMWPRRPPGFRGAVSAYYQSMEALAGRLARMFALALDLPELFFVDKFDRHVSTMRLNFYPAQPVAPLPGQIRAGAHSDYGAFTILRTEAAPGGLQVVRRGGSWIDVPNVPDGFVVNIGDLLMRWTNDRWVSTVHRVINPPDAVRANATRMSVAFFQVPNHDIEVRCFESCTAPSNPPRYAPTTAGAHWRAKIVAARGEPLPPAVARTPVTAA